MPDGFPASLQRIPAHYSCGLFHRDMPFKPCYCLSHTCRGQLQDARVYKQHRDEDWLTIASTVEEASHEAVETQHRLMSEYIAAQTVLGHVSVTPSPPEHLPTPSLSGSARERVRRVLARLGKIGDRVDAYAIRVDEALAQHLLPPSETSSTRFPLNPLIQEANTFKDELEVVTLTDASVKSLKQSILKKTEKSLASLLDKKGQWKKCMDEKRQPSSLAAGRVKYDSGKRRTAEHHTLRLTPIQPTISVVPLNPPTLRCRFSFLRWSHSTYSSLSPKDRAGSCSKCIAIPSSYC